MVDNEEGKMVDEIVVEYDKYFIVVMEIKSLRVFL